MPTALETMNKYLALNPSIRLHVTADNGYLAPVMAAGAKSSDSGGGKPFLVNHTAARLLMLADGTQRVSQIVDRCAAELGRPKEGFLDKLTQFLDTAEKCGQVLLTDEPNPIAVTVTGSLRCWYPLHAMVELTTACNLRCVHCYRSVPDNHAPVQPETFATEDCLGVLEQLCRNGCCTIEFSGGEPLLHADLCRILEFALDRFEVVAVITNGTRITEEFCQWAKRWSDRLHFSVSLDASSPEMHDRMRGLVGAFQRTTNGIRLLVANGLHVRAGMTISQGSVEDFENTILLAKELGCTRFAFGPVFPFGRGATFSRRPLSQEEANRIAQYIHDVSRKYADFVGLVDAGSMDMLDLIGNCGLAHRSITIAPNGDVRPCPTMPTIGPVLGNICRDEYEDIFSNPIVGIIRRLRAPEPATCGDCARLGFCRGCVLRGLYSLVNHKPQCAWALASGVEKWLDRSAFADPYSGSEESPGWVLDISGKKTQT
jgi:radical SAM protein with 4Fe4S-binding SPASM domain